MKNKKTNLVFDFKKNELINKVLLKYYETFQLTLDTADFVPEKYSEKISSYIFKNLKRKFRDIDKEYKKYSKEKKLLEKPPKEKSKKLSLWRKISLKIMSRKKRKATKGSV